MRSGRTHVIVVVLALAALAAGCGGGLSAEEYGEEVEGVLTPLGEDLQTIGSDAQTTPEGVAGGLEDIEVALGGAIADLEDVEPPDDLQEPHDRLILALSDFEAATGEALEGAEGAEAPDSPEFQSVITDYVTAATEFQQAVSEVDQEFQDAGLEITPQTTVP